ncbi:serine/threonine-protein kinase HT1 [Pelomyxa schiedti]|nr:serine/threonine-protein kinase HT1 [Pelomyxa schiedti]
MRVVGWLTVISLVVALSTAQTAYVSAPVADIRSSNLCPTASPCCDYTIDRCELTQVLFGDELSILEVQGDWAYVEIPGQYDCDNGTWGFYQGWIETSKYVVPTKPMSPTLSVIAPYAPVYKRSCESFGCLPSDQLFIASMGTWLAGRVLSNGWWKVMLPDGTFGYIADSMVQVLDHRTDDVVRAIVIAQAKKLLGSYYFWGGRSSFIGDYFSSNTVLTGVDCSGLAGLSFQSAGYLIPRDADPQFLMSRNVTDGPTALQPGDLFFYASPSNPDYKTHVMMMYDSETIIESTVSEPAFNGTRMIPIKEAYGMDLADLKWGQPVSNGELLFWGTYFPWTPHTLIVFNLITAQQLVGIMDSTTIGTPPTTHQLFTPRPPPTPAPRSAQAPLSTSPPAAQARHPALCPPSQDAPAAAAPPLRPAPARPPATKHRGAPAAGAAEPSSSPHVRPAAFWPASCSAGPAAADAAAPDTVSFEPDPAPQPRFETVPTTEEMANQFRSFEAIIQKRRAAAQLLSSFIGIPQSVVESLEKESIVHQGELTKISRRNQHHKRLFILFEKSILCGAKSKKDSKYKFKIMFDKFRVEVIQSAGTPNSFNLISRYKSFILQAQSADEKQCWLQLMEGVFDNVQAHVGTSTNLDQAWSPPFLPDSESGFCSQCSKSFTLTRRRHHCRKCGKIFCTKCSSKRVLLPVQSSEVRVCDGCFAYLELHPCSSEPEITSDRTHELRLHFTPDYLQNQSQWQDILRDPILLKVALNMAKSGEVTLHQPIEPQHLVLDRSNFLGKGSSGLVFRATYKQQQVALKETQAYSDNGEFLKEVAILSLINHPNLLGCFCASINPNWIITDILDKTLTTYLEIDANSPPHIPQETITHILYGAASGMSYLHQMGLLHRDLKTDNIMLSIAANGITVKIIDYGSSRLLDQKNMTVCVGTPTYMAPEVYEKPKYTFSSDVYSFSIIMWECFAKVHAYKEWENIVRLSENVRKGARPQPLVPPLMPPPLADLMKKCWNADPEKRPTFPDIKSILARHNKVDSTTTSQNNS